MWHLRLWGLTALMSEIFNSQTHMAFNFNCFHTITIHIILSCKALKPLKPILLQGPSCLAMENISREESGQNLSHPVPKTWFMAIHVTDLKVMEETPSFGTR